MSDTNGQQIESSDPRTGDGKRAAAPTGNRNRLKHGLRSKRFGLSLGKAPEWARHDVSETRKYQRGLETETLQRYGAIGVSEAGQIISAGIHALRLRLAIKWLAAEAGPNGKVLTIEQRIALLNLMGSATDAKDKVVARLFEKPSKAESPWAEFDRMRTLPAVNGSEAEPTPPNATATKSSDVASNEGPTE